MNRSAILLALGLLLSASAGAQSPIQIRNPYLGPTASAPKAVPELAPAGATAARPSPPVGFQADGTQAAPQKALELLANQLVLAGVSGDSLALIRQRADMTGRSVVHAVRAGQVWYLDGHEFTVRINPGLSPEVHLLRLTGAEGDKKLSVVIVVRAESAPAANQHAPGNRALGSYPAPAPVPQVGVSR